MKVTICGTPAYIVPNLDRVVIEQDRIRCGADGERRDLNGYLEILDEILSTGKWDLSLTRPGNLPLTLSPGNCIAWHDDSPAVKIEKMYSTDVEWMPENNTEVIAVNHQPLGDIVVFLVIETTPVVAVLHESGFLVHLFTFGDIDINHVLAHLLSLVMNHYWEFKWESFTWGDHLIAPHVPVPDEPEVDTATVTKVKLTLSPIGPFSRAVTLRIIRDRDNITVEVLKSWSNVHISHIRPEVDILLGTCDYTLVDRQHL